MIRQKALKRALWDNSCISFLSSTFMLQEVKVLERNGFVDTQLSFLLFALLLFSADWVLQVSSSLTK